MTRTPVRPSALVAAALLAASLPAGGAPAAHAADDAFPARYAAPYLQIAKSTVVDMAADRAATGLKYYSLAFLASKSGCTLQWEDGGDPVGAFTTEIEELRSSGGDVIISFGGGGSKELAQTCTAVADLTEAYRDVVDTYGVSRLDFDIEGPSLADTAANRRRDQALAALQAADPEVRVGFTVPVAPTGLLPNVTAMLEDARTAGVVPDLVNLMTMDFGDGENPLTDAESAATATEKQLAAAYGGSAADNWARTGLTPIAGRNDDDENFTQADASALAGFAADNGVRQLSFWEVHAYDRPTGYAYSALFNRS